MKSSVVGGVKTAKSVDYNSFNCTNTIAKRFDILIRTAAGGGWQCVIYFSKIRKLNVVIAVGSLNAPRKTINKTHSFEYFTLLSILYVLLLCSIIQ